MLLLVLRGRTGEPPGRETIRLPAGDGIDDISIRGEGESPARKSRTSNNELGRDEPRHDNIEADESRAKRPNLGLHVRALARSRWAEQDVEYMASKNETEDAPLRARHDILDPSSWRASNLRLVIYSSTSSKMAISTAWHKQALDVERIYDRL